MQKIWGVGHMADMVACASAFIVRPVAVICILTFARTCIYVGRERAGLGSEEENSTFGI